MKWLPELRSEDVIILESGKRNKLVGTKYIFISSYDTASKLLKGCHPSDRRESDINTYTRVEEIKSMILDDIHKYSNLTCKTLKPIFSHLKKCNRIIFSTSVPNIKRPSDLYTFLKILRPDIFNNENLFKCRYCNGTFRNKYSVNINGQGFSKVKELEIILYEKFMVRSVSNSLISVNQRLMIEVL